ncbi:unnamed protein product [Paramecium sonneborni]|uniref:Uncharacterized protein n=1 Tax=Paramecium sonneborni TaxID=65129 RepID=A0A8S1RRV0_9CILI|nr:unnamed protein product [Paramecium sonneborni]
MNYIIHQPKTAKKQKTFQSGFETGLTQTRLLTIKKQKLTTAIQKEIYQFNFDLLRNDQFDQQFILLQNQKQKNNKKQQLLFSDKILNSYYNKSWISFIMLVDIQNEKRNFEQVRWIEQDLAFQYVVFGGEQFAESIDKYRAS